MSNSFLFLLISTFNWVQNTLTYFSEKSCLYRLKKTSYEQINNHLTNYLHKILTNFKQFIAKPNINRQSPTTLLYKNLKTKLKENVERINLWSAQDSISVNHVCIIIILFWYNNLTPKKKLKFLFPIYKVSIANIPNHFLTAKRSSHRPPYQPVFTCHPTKNLPKIYPPWSKWSPPRCIKIPSSDHFPAEQAIKLQLYSIIVHGGASTWDKQHLSWLIRAPNHGKPRGTISLGRNLWPPVRPV